MRRCKDVQEAKQRQFKKDILNPPLKDKSNFKNCIAPLSRVGQKHNTKAQEFRKSTLFLGNIFTQPDINIS